MVEALGIQIDQLSLDLTYLFSDMTGSSRTQLVGVAIKRFLTQVGRHDVRAYESLDKQLHGRYAPSVHQLLEGSNKEGESR